MIEVTAGIIISDQKVLLAKRKEGKSLAGYWEFPGGKIETNETAQESLIRELNEEFNIKTEILSKFHENIHHYENKTVNLHSYFVKHIEGEYLLNDHSEICWTKIENVLDYNLAPADIPTAIKLMQRHVINRAYYSNTIDNFLKESENEIRGSLMENHTNRTLDEQQRNAWRDQIRILKDQLKNIEGHIFFEFAIPRMGKRVDNIIIANDKVFVIEFKVGETEYHNHDKDQVEDYVLDLKNFHEGSHNLNLIPVLVASEANSIISDSIVLTNKTNLGESIKQQIDYDAQSINVQEWSDSIYKPTPTIIEAAQALYKGHSVKEISRSDSGAINLTKTASCLNRIIEDSKANNQKTICFVTGVPGAGKTLAGLNIANERMQADESEHAVFLSGNGPLVDVLREALARDLVSTKKKQGIKFTKKEAQRNTHSFIQNIHHFRDEYLSDLNPPVEKVVVFDEAQRAWNKHQASSFMKRKKGYQDFNKSEPEFLIEVMNRHNNWCTIICLIGGGQEINTGEAGLEEWMIALKDRFSNWKFHFSDQIVSNDNYLRNQETIAWVNQNGIKHSELHLAVSVRSFRSEKLSQFVKELLDLKQANAKSTFITLKSEYPIYLTRDLEIAKDWVKTKANGTERIGLIASSGARRLRPLGIDVKNEINAPNWFLNRKEDVRSSYYLEDVATEFDIQGLEIDWACVAWGANFHLKDGNWQYQNFKGSKWMNINQAISKDYLKNTYRVLLTRARQGIIIYIPEGSRDDKTRPCKYYDETYQYLLCVGIKEVRHITQDDQGITPTS